jgi:hypothetical protein
MDIIYNEDISVKSGDFEKGDNNLAIASDVINATKGNFFWSPLLGYGAPTKINSELDYIEEQGQIIDELKKVNIKLSDFDLIENNINLSIQ